MANTITEGTPVTPPAVTASDARLTYYDLLSAVGDMLGHGTSPSGKNLTIVRECIRTGYRRFINPPVMKALGDRYAHTWSWLAPTSTLALAVDDWGYTLPADFAQIVNDFVYPAGVNTSIRLKQVAPDQILQARQDNNISGDPRIYAVRPLSFASDTGQLYEVIFWPNPGTVRTLTYRYAAEQDSFATAKVTGSDGTVAAGSLSTLTTAAGTFATVAAGDVVIISSASGPTVGIYTVASVTDTTNLVITGGFGAAGTCSWEVLPASIYPVGALEASEALRACCLWAAEEGQDDVTGMHAARAMQELEAAIQRDRARGPRNLGVMRDDSDVGDVARYPDVVAYTHNGVTLS